MRFARRKQTSLSFELLEDRTVPSTVDLLIDLNQVPRDSNPSSFVRAGEYIYFTAITAKEGGEIWRTDGTPEGTILLRDINPGWQSSSPGSMQSVESNLYFVADDGVNGSEIWKTDGTPESTVRVTNLQEQVDPTVTQVIRWNNSTYFVTNSGLYREWGPQQGAVRLSALRPLNRSAVVVGDSLFFYASDVANNYEPWRLDPGSDTPVRVKDIRPGNLGSFKRVLGPAVNGVVYFSADDGVSGEALWRSDGTTEGTFRVFDPLPGSSDETYVQNLTQVKGRLFLTAYDGSSGSLFVTDGTAAGTKRLTTEFGLPLSSIWNLTVVGTTLYLTGRNVVFGNELFKVEEGSETIKLVRDIAIGFGKDSDPGGLFEAGGLLYFVAKDHDGVWKQWRSDGTMEGTVISPFVVSSLSEVLKGEIFYAKRTIESGLQLWATDFTTAETRLVSIIDRSTNGSFPQHPQLTQVGDLVYFFAGDGFRNGLWRTNGTVAGTEFLREFSWSPGTSPQPAGFTAIGHKLYFRAYDPIHFDQIWRTDGTPAGTVRVSSFAPISPGSQSTFLARNPFECLSIQDSLYFFGESSQGVLLYKIDSATDTLSVASLLPQIRRDDLYGFMSTGEQIFFFEVIPGSTRRLWRTDGTAAGTKLIWGDDPSLRPYFFDTGPLIPLGNSVYFAGSTGQSDGTQLWKSDGTSEGTGRVTDFGFNVPRISNLTRVGDAIYFLLASSGASESLWKYVNGSTVAVDLTDEKYPGSTHSIRNLTAVGDSLYFESFRYVPFDRFVRGIYRVNAANTGVKTVFEFDPTTATIYPEVGWMRGIGETLFFTYAKLGRSASYLDLWISDGTEEGTYLLEQLSTPPFSQNGYSASYPESLFEAGESLIFVATTLEHGRELRVINQIPLRATIVGPDGLDEGQVGTYHLTSSSYFPKVTPSTNFTWSIDWEGDGVVDETVVGSSSIEVSHSFPVRGTYRLRVGVVDSRGNSTESDASITVRVPAPVFEIVQIPTIVASWEPFEVQFNIEHIAPINGAYPISVDLDADGVNDRFMLVSASDPKMTISVNVKMAQSSLVVPIRFTVFDVNGPAATLTREVEERTAVRRVIDGVGTLIVGGTSVRDTITIRWSTINQTTVERLINGGSGEWTLFFENIDRAYVYAGPSGDEIIGDSFDKPLIVDGGEGDDTLRGGPAKDSLVGGLGNDWIIGNGENDLLVGDRDQSKSRGNDTIYGGEGNDSIYGDRVPGDADGAEGGNDLLIGGLDDDLIDARTGRDTVDTSGGGDDTVLGGRQADRVARVGILPSSILTDIALSVDDDDEPVVLEFVVDEKSSRSPWSTSGGKGEAGKSRQVNLPLEQEFGR